MVLRLSNCSLINQAPIEPNRSLASAFIDVKALINIKAQTYLRLAKSIARDEPMLLPIKMILLSSNPTSFYTKLKTCSASSRIFSAEGEPA